MAETLSSEAESALNVSEMENVLTEISENQEDQPLAKFVIPVLKIIKDAQGQHGLRYGDYQRYRQYCTRRMRRLRRSLKFLHWEQGKGKSKFVQKVISAGMVVDSRFLLLVLNKAERAWAYAMQLRDKADGQVGREVHHLMRRLGKAAKYGALFEQLAKEKADDRTALEAEAYAAFLQGSLLLEEEKWELALERLARCRTVYDELGKVAEAQEQKLYKERVDELDPSIRYCRHNMLRQGGGKGGEGERVLLSDLSSDLLKGKVDKVLAADAADALEVAWLDRSVAVTHLTLRQHILAAHGYAEEARMAEGAEGKLERFDKLLMSLEDAKRVIRDEIADKLKAGGAADEDHGRLQLARTYVQGLMLMGTRDRDLVLVTSLREKLRAAAAAGGGGAGGGAGYVGSRKGPRAEDVVKLFETIAQTVEEYGTLDGVAAHAELAKLVAARLLLFKAWRIVYVGESYASGSRDLKYAEAYALMQRAQQLGKVARVRMEEAGSRPDQTDRWWLAELDRVVRERRIHLHAAAAMASPAGKPGESSEPGPGEVLKALAATPLSTRLNNYEAATFGDPAKAPRLVDFPPPIEAVACKPVLFDLALNQVTYPDLSSRTKKKAAAAAGGVLSWFRRS